MGIKVHTGVKILEILSGPEGGVMGVKLFEDGEETILEVGLVCVSAGVRPRDELAKAAGLKLGGRGGVHVDEKQRSSDASVWAVSEVASIGGGMCYGLSAPGRHQAQVCVYNLLDKSSSAAYAGSDLSTKLKLMGVDLGSFGGSADFWFKRQY